MAIYHLTVNTVSRGSGSAGAKSDYINREGKYKKDKEEVLYKESGNMPEWAKENKKYWESADIYERQNARLFKQLEFALPKELNMKEQQELVKAFVEKVTTTPDGKIPYSYAIHKGHDKENPHCHLMLSERPIDGINRSPETWFKRANSKKPELGGAKKTTSLMPKEWLENVREQWSIEANKSLEKSGIKQRIDHRSLEAQGIDREPSKHRGVKLNAMLIYGKIKPHEVKRDISKPIEKQTTLKRLAEAKKQKEYLTANIATYRQRYLKTKADKERERAEQLQKEKAERLEKQKKIQEERQKEIVSRQRIKGIDYEEAQKTKSELVKSRKKEKSRDRGMGR